jgi:hypothetical protein
MMGGKVKASSTPGGAEVQNSNFEAFFTHAKDLSIQMFGGRP